eukprot:6250428-Prorocentrum_lima.AAC.1
MAARRGGPRHNYSLQLIDVELGEFRPGHPPHSLRGGEKYHGGGADQQPAMRPPGQWMPEEAAV